MTFSLCLGSNMSEALRGWDLSGTDWSKPVRSLQFHFVFTSVRSFVGLALRSGTYDP